MSSLNKILVPVDFSEPSRNALQYAIVLATKTNAEIHLLHVYHIPVVDPYMPGDTMEALLDETRKAAEQSMREFLNSAGYGRITSEVRMGFVSDDVVEVGADKKIDLIVMGTTGASGLREVFFGSVASAVIEKSPVKVLAIPETYTSRTMPATIAYAADFKDDEKNMFRLLCDLCEIWGCTLKVLHVRTDDEEPGFGRARFDTLKTTHPFNTIHFEQIEDRDIVDAIQHYAESSACDILAMAMHHRNLIERLFHKSKTKEVAHHTKIPLLALHKRD